MSYYDMYRNVFGLADTQAVIADVWPGIRVQVMAITRFWDDSACVFCDHAVDSQFQWGEDAGILTVYRLYVPIIGGPDNAIQHQVDDSAWRAEHGELLKFLGLAQADVGRVKALTNRLEAVDPMFGRAIREPK